MSLGVGEVGLLIVTSQKPTEISRKNIFCSAMLGYVKITYIHIFFLIFVCHKICINDKIVLLFYICIIL